MNDREPPSWPHERLGELTVELARVCRLTASHHRVAATPAELPVARAAEWVTAIASSIAVEAWPERVTHAQLPERLASADSMIIGIEESSPPRYIAIISGGQRQSRVLSPDGRTLVIATRSLRAAIVREVEAPVAAAAQPLLDAIGELSASRDAVAHVIVDKKLASRVLSTVVRLQVRPAAGVWQRCRRARIPSQVAQFAGAYAAQYALWLLSWWIAGQWALRGMIEWGWVAGWILLFATIVPMQLTCAWLQGMLSMKIGAVIKQRLLISGLSLDVDSLRSHGPSQFLARVLESQVVENGLVHGGFVALLGVIELAYAALILCAGAVGPLHGLLLLAWFGLFVFMGWLYFLRRKQWTIARLAMTHEMAEGMIGNRTRVTQQPPGEWHRSEDDALRRYLARSKSMDDLGVVITPIPWHGWVLVAVVTLLIPISRGSFNTTELAISVGGILLGGRAMGLCLQAFGPIVDAAIAWEQVKRFLRVTPADTAGVPEYAIREADSAGTVDARELVFSYDGRLEPVVRGWSLRIRRGDRVLLEGTSGGGKSTFISLLAGLRESRSGALLIDGVDRPVYGTAAWRRHVVAAPQFHENHVVAETFAFNLLMGKRWPPLLGDVEKARTICAELGLEPLLERMPAGLFQFVGETGWQLSHGERSRLFIARALLQEPDLIILDESFAALDPETLELAFACVKKHARAMLVVAHP